MASFPSRGDGQQLLVLRERATCPFQPKENGLSHRKRERWSTAKQGGWGEQKREMEGVSVSQRKSGGLPVQQSRARLSAAPSYVGVLVTDAHGEIREYKGFARA
ncbi:protein FAM117B [Platysternon megacephalum]|uniref:Protein FAM117B n=1 Tax=Platysternon megacephalum TaxID=55544 RepID=A0A4D9EQT8_9SAUR|nr:protein FAM117B [Platysternon megacephalum]